MTMARMPLSFNTAPFAEPTVVTIEPVPLAVVRFANVTRERLRPLLDLAYTSLGAAIGYGTLHTAGPALVLFHDGTPQGAFAIDVGFPIVEPLSGALEREGLIIEPSEAPAGRALVQTAVGPYDDLPAAWEQLIAAADARGLVPSGNWIEVYVSDPDVPASGLRTDLVAPLAD